jgi:hypothetical protein
MCMCANRSSGELDRPGEEAVVAYFKVLSRNWLGRMGVPTEIRMRHLSDTVYKTLQPGNWIDQLVQRRATDWMAGVQFPASH